MSIISHDNALSIDLIKRIFETVYNNKQWMINKHGWQKQLTETSVGIVNTTFLKDEIFREIETSLKPFLQNEEIGSIQYYEWNQLSQINWHNDGRHDAGITVYLNEKWDENWGGFFCWKGDGDVRHFILPTFNRAIIVRGSLKHHVSLISPYADARKTLQVWLKKKQV